MSINEADLRKGSDVETIEYVKEIEATRNGNTESPIQTPQLANRHPQNPLTSINSSSPIFGCTNQLRASPMQERLVKKRDVTQEENRMQGMLGPAFASPNFHQDVGSHQMQLLNNHFPTKMEALMGSPFSFQLEGMSSGNNNNQMTMNWLYNIPPASNIDEVNRIPHGQNSFIRTPAQDPRFPRNSLYDPMYEAMGLPVDPHLRMFLARCGAGRKW